MPSTRNSLKDTWRTATSFDSVWVWLPVVVVAGGVGLFISWELSRLWEHLFGYSSVLTVLTAIIVPLLSYFCLSYLTSAALQLER